MTRGSSSSVYWLNCGYARQLLAESLVELFHLVALFASELLSFFKFAFGKRRAQMLGGLDVDDLGLAEVDGRKDRDVVEVAIPGDDRQRPGPVLWPWPFRLPCLRLFLRFPASAWSCLASFPESVEDSLSVRVSSPGLASSSTPTTYSRRSAAGSVAPSVFLRSSVIAPLVRLTASFVCWAVNPGRDGSGLGSGHRCAERPRRLRPPPRMRPTVVRYPSSTTLES